MKLYGQRRKFPTITPQRDFRTRRLLKRELVNDDFKHSRSTLFQFKTQWSALVPYTQNDGKIGSRFSFNLCLPCWICVSALTASIAFRASSPGRPRRGSWTRPGRVGGPRPRGWPPSGGRARTGGSGVRPGSYPSLDPPVKEWC